MLNSKLQELSTTKINLWEISVNKNLRLLLQEILPTHSNKKIALLSYFSTFKGEIKISPLRNKSSEEIIPFYPQVTTSEMFFLKSENKFTKGIYGIYEPQDGEVFQPENFDLAIVLIPGLGFDTDGNRLGRGKGYYDRFLGNLTKSLPTIKIGIGISCQLVSDIPVENHDQKMDFLVLETGHIRTTKLP